MYNCVDTHITPDGRVFIKLIKKTQQETFGERIYKYDTNNREVSSIIGSIFDYTRNGNLLIGTIVLPKSAFTEIGFFVFEDWLVRGIKGNIRGVIDGNVCTVYPDAWFPDCDCCLSLVRQVKS